MSVKSAYTVSIFEYSWMYYYCYYKITPGKTYQQSRGYSYLFFIYVMNI